MLNLSEYMYINYIYEVNINLKSNQICKKHT